MFLLVRYCAPHHAQPITCLLAIEVRGCATSGMHPGDPLPPDIMASVFGPESAQVEAHYCLPLPASTIAFFDWLLIFQRKADLSDITTVVSVVQDAYRRLVAAS